jgi:hypothetical protein
LQNNIKRLCHEKKLKYLVKIDPKCNILVNIWYSLYSTLPVFKEKEREQKSRKGENEWKEEKSKNKKFAMPNTLFIKEYWNSARDRAVDY